jgi:hypothetical protein
VERKGNSGTAGPVVPSGSASEACPVRVWEVLRKAEGSQVDAGEDTVIEWLRMWRSHRAPTPRQLSHKDHAHSMT